MPDDAERPSLEPPQLFGRKRKAKPAPEPVEVEPEVVEKAGPEPTEQTEVLEVEQEPTFTDAAIVETAPPSPPAMPAKPAKPAKPAPATPPARQPEPEPDAEAGPALAGLPAALVTGLVVGAVLVGLTWAGMRGCEAARGTSSCGTGPGMLGLIAILVLAVVVGSVLLRGFGVPDPGATSFLAVGLTGAIALLFLVDVLDTWPMLIVIPAVTAATFLLSWWVTTTFVESDAA